jgi:hypothetical protein
MFTPSREKVEAAERYLAERKAAVRGWANTKGKGGGRQRTGKPLWHSLPKEWHDEANARLRRLVNKFWAEHGHSPSHHKYVSLIGNVVDIIRNRRMTNHHRQMRFKYSNALVVLDPSKHIPNPFDASKRKPRDFAYYEKRREYIRKYHGHKAWRPGSRGHAPWQFGQPAVPTKPRRSDGNLSGI